MKIEKLVLKNFRSFEEEPIEFPKSNITVLVGPNGCGKSSVLDALGYVSVQLMLSFKSDKKPYSLFDLVPIPSDIKRGKESLEVGARLLDSYSGTPLEFSFNQKGRIFSPPSINNKLSEKSSALPLLVYYRTDRTMNSDWLHQETKPVVSIIGKFTAYANAFSSVRHSFCDFENWFLAKENFENQEKVNGDFSFKLDELQVVRSALKDFLQFMNKEELKELKGAREYNRDGLFTTSDSLGRLIINKGKETLNLSQLSSGEKMLILLVADIARRLTILNENSKDSLQGNGIVLIDEIEMHLHPGWQRNIIPALKAVFPNVQFIVTTHSPQVISSVTSEEIIILEDGKSYKTNTNPIGRDSNGILEEIFDVKERPEHVDNLIDEIYLLISKGDVESSQLETKVEALKKSVSKADPILIGIENLISRTKILQS